MEQDRYIKLFNPKLKIGMVSWREAWLFDEEFPVRLYTEVHKGKLVFRKRGSSVRISFQQVKKDLSGSKYLLRKCHCQA